LPQTESRSSARRAWLAGLGLGAAGLGTLAWRLTPPWFKLLAQDLGSPIPPAAARPTPKLWPDKGLHAAWLGHSTVLLKIDGTTVLTDPVLGNRIGLDFGLFTFGPQRLIGPALTAQDLPSIDLILLSHAHMDHMDLPTLRQLESPTTTVVTATATSDLLRVQNYAQVHEIGWGQSVQVGPLRIRGLEVNHWGARMRSDTWRGYNAYLLETSARRILFGGDTADTTLFRGLPPSQLAIMPIGAYQPWIRAHCSPEQAWRMAQEARSELFIGIHHRTFRLSQEPQAEPLHRLLSAAGSRAQDVLLHQIGAQTSIS